ncbi:MAG: glutamate formimidoyltransferase [Synergistetes bacterium]|nr:glutamate formimidoyltransferase [Synergistota bacterium]
MRRLVECIPNFSEGRRKEVVEAIVEPFKGVDGVSLLDYSADPDHNRMVVTAVGDPDVMLEVVFKAVEKAVELINMEEHKGEHPRIGAVDVIPFVPVSGVTMEECVELAHRLGKRINKELGIPIYFYEEAALRPERKKLEVIRRGEYEALKQEITKPERHPDVGEPRMHPTAGATVVGARRPLVAFNINLGTDDAKVAKEIAKAIRASSGGFSTIKARGMELKERGIVQVSMNITDYKKNPIYRILEVVRMEAKRWGVEVIGTEIIGLLPVDAILDSAKYYMQIKDFSDNQVLELRLLEMGG